MQIAAGNEYLERLARKMMFLCYAAYKENTEECIAKNAPEVTVCLTSEKLKQDLQICIYHCSLSSFPKLSAYSSFSIQKFPTNKQKE